MKTARPLLCSFLKACVEATHSSKGNRNWNSTPHTEVYNKDKYMWSWMLGIKSYFFLGASGFMPLRVAFVKMRLLEMVETV